MKKTIEYPIGIPSFYWKIADWNPKLFKQYVYGYLKRNHPGFNPQRVKKGKYIVCVREDNAE